MNKTKLILASVLTLALLVPMVNAAPLWSDDWFIEHAEEYVNDKYTDHENLNYTGEVVSGWKASFRPWVLPNKLVELNATYEDNNYHDKGQVIWSGGVYFYGDCFTNTYIDIKPTQHKTFKQNTVYLGGLNTLYFFDDNCHLKTYEPITYKNYTAEPMTVHFTLYGYNVDFTVKPGYCLSVYTPYNSYY